MSTTTTTTEHEPQRCEMFCSKPLGPDDPEPEPPGSDWKSTCRSCEVALKWLCGEFLPSIRKFGYWSPPGAGPELELAAIVDQDGLRNRMREALDAFTDVRTVDGRSLGEALFPPREER